MQSRSLRSTAPLSRREHATTENNECRNRRVTPGVEPHQWLDTGTVLVIYCASNSMETLLYAIYCIHNVFLERSWFQRKSFVACTIFECHILATILFVPHVGSWRLKVPCLYYYKKIWGLGRCRKAGIITSLKRKWLKKRKDERTNWKPKYCCCFRLDYMVLW